MEEMNENSASVLENNTPHDIDDCEDGGIRIGDIYIPPPPLPALTFETTGPRLIITHIENINFKSYAGYQQLGPFHKNFTSIVGPNGSGKSNVIDAMLFVFGYRAAKIRSKKVGILIHDSGKHRGLESCTVRVHFQMINDKGDDGYEAVPGSSFSISRTAFKDNSSVYEINGRKAQFKEVSKLLRSYGIDLDHNRFLILQGEIEMIAMMKPKGQTEHDTGMLEYLEDIIGCNRFIEPIKKLAESVEQLNEVRLEKFNRMKAVEKEKEEIEAAKDEAVEYLKLENEVAVRENSVFQVRLKESEIELDDAFGERNELKKDMDNLALAQEEIKVNKAMKEKEYDELHTMYEKCLRAVEDCLAQYSDLERQDVRCIESINHSKAKIKSLVKNLETEEGKLANLKKQPATYEAETAQLQEKKQALEVKKKTEEKKVEEVMASLKQETSSLQEEKDKQEAVLIGLKKTADEAKSKMDIAQSELDLYLTAEKNEETRLKDLLTNLQKVTSTVKEKKRLHEEAERRIPEAEAKLKTAKQNFILVTEKEAKASEEVKAKRIRVEEAKSSMNASRKRSITLEALMEQKRQGILSGVHGRLGDLGAIDEKYDVAISTACGSLDNIVTDTMITAQKCVEFLKRSGKGYTTFIPLDKMEKWQFQTRQRIQTPENVPRLFDLIKVKDTRVLTAFYHALRDTLVATDLEQATRIGLQGKTRRRVVTLKGELIDLSGTMTGGGKSVLKGRMGQSVAASEISPRELEKEIQQLNVLTKTAAELRTDKNALEDFIEKTEREISSLQHALNANRMEFQALQENEVSLKKRIAEQEKKVAAAAPDAKKVAEMKKTVEKAKAAYEKARKAAAEVETEVQKLHSQIMAITEGKFKAAQKALDKLIHQIDEVQTAITKSNVSVKTARRNVKKCEDKVESLKAEIEENKKSREALMQEYKQIEDKAKEVMLKKEAAEAEKKDFEEKKKLVMLALNALKEKEHKLKSENIDLRNKVKLKEAIVKEKQDKVKTWKIKLSKLQIQQIDDEIPSPLPTLTTEELEAIAVNALTYEIGTLEAQMQKMKPNMAAIAEFRRKEELYSKKVAELEEVTKQRDERKTAHDELRKRRLDEFMAAFKIITSKLKEVYQMITLGGDAELELVDSLDPFSEGIVFSVRPPKKSWKNISNLSGGEKTLSSLALVFALHYYKPTPFYVMDEIDAALDFKNVSIVGNYIKERTKNAQFIIISLRNNMFELSDRLVGIFKTYDCTKCCTITPDEIIKENGVPVEESTVAETRIET